MKNVDVSAESATSPRVGGWWPRQGHLIRQNNQVYNTSLQYKSLQCKILEV